MAKGIDLDHQPERDALFLSQLDQTIEDCLPSLVASEIVVRNEELVNALHPVLAHQILDVIR